MGFMVCLDCHNRITLAVKSSGRLRQRLYNVAYNAKKDALEKGKTPSPIWDRLVFNKIKGVLGGRVRCLCSGASPISPDVLDFLRICFGGFVSEGYGMTETSCLVAGSEEDDKTSGHVGPPTPACGKKKTFQKNQCHLCFQIPHASTHSLNHN
jgi:long-chain acyl-CoA synthetase